MTYSDRPNPVVQMDRMLTGHLVAQCLHVFAVLGIADLIEDGTVALDDLATRTGTSAPHLGRVLDTLAGHGVLTRSKDGAYGLTSLGETLRSDVAQSLRYKAMFEISPPIWTTAGGLLGTVRDGVPAFARLLGQSIYEYLAANTDLWATFNQFMTAQSASHNQAIVDAYDFSGTGMLVDVGGGLGGTLGAILDRNPSIKGILFDLPEVVAKAGDDEGKSKPRFDLRGGNMLEAVPEGGDVYIIKRVMMDKTDEDAVTVLRNCKTSMNDGGKILVIDPVLPDPIIDHQNWAPDILMMLVTHGKCRTESQFGSLFERAGLRVERTVQTNSPNVIIEGVKQ